MGPTAVVLFLHFRLHVYSDYFQMVNRMGYRSRYKPSSIYHWPNDRAAIIDGLDIRQAFMGPIVSGITSIHLFDDCFDMCSMDAHS